MKKNPVDFKNSGNTEAKCNGALKDYIAQYPKYLGYVLQNIVKNYLLNRNGNK